MVVVAVSLTCLLVRLYSYYWRMEARERSEKKGIA
jgi:hypothetical protein